MREYIVNKKVRIKAEPSKVWDALTNPEKTKEYFFHCGVYSDWKKGSAITFKGNIFFFFPIEMKGQIINIKPEKLLKYKLTNGKSATISTVTDELTYENGVTTLSISDNVGQGEDAEKRYKKSVKGWSKVLKGLKELVEEEEK
jgi:uncharacterized protein YndB with AHSA1/START domain